MINNQNLKNGFTLVELLIVIALIGILSTLTVLALQNARQKTRDAERLSSVNQIMAALGLGFAELANYPAQVEGDLILGEGNAKALCEVGGRLSFVENQSECAGTVFMSIVPASVRPRDGSCTDSQNVYAYRAGSGGVDFKLEFCLGKAVAESGLQNGLNCVTPTGLAPGACE